MEKQVFVERQTLSDGSRVYNVLLDVSSRLCLICASQLDAETIGTFLQEQIDANHIIGIE